MRSIASQRDSIGSWLRSILVFGSYYLYFTFADLSNVLERQKSLLSPDLTAYSIWLVIYLFQFAFVCYQLFNRDARRNSLVNKKLILPYISHQILFAAWLRFFQAEWVLLSTILYTFLWLMTFLCYLLITFEFRNGEFVGYKLQSWLMIEVPFALLLGWETFTLLVNWNSTVVLLTNLTGAVSPAAELTAFIVSLLVIVQAAVLFAGLSILMNPFLHIGLVWGCTFTSKRLLNGEFPDFSAPTVSVVPTAAGVASGCSALITALYLLVSLSILCQSRFCMPEDGDCDSMIVGNGGGATGSIDDCDIGRHHVYGHPPPSAPACVIPISLRSGQVSTRRLTNTSLPPPSTRLVT